MARIGRIGRSGSSSSPAQAQQVARQVPAVHSRDVPRRQRPQRQRVIPVEEVTLVSLKALHRLEHPGSPVNESVRRDIPEVVRREVRQECEPHVRRRRAVRDHGGGVLLKIVRRQPVVFGPDERLEEAPRPGRQIVQKLLLVALEGRGALRGHPADPPRQER